MLNNFSLPSWFDASNDIKDTLIELWNKSYFELYEEQYVDECFLITDVLKSDLVRLIKLCENENKEKTFERLVYFNWALCKAARPTIDEYISDSLIYDSILSDLSTWSFNREFNDRFSNICLPSYRSYIIAEAVTVYQNMMVLSKRENMLELLLDSIDCCLEGTAISPSSVDKRAIFNWLLIEVFPSAYYLRLPDFIYTISFNIEGWSYSKH